MALGAQSEEGIVMAGDVVVTSGALRLVLDFAEVDMKEIGVRVCLQIDYSGMYQTVTWTVDQLWIEYDELCKFENELLGGTEAMLRDMSDYPVLHLKRHPSGEILAINPINERQSRDGQAMMVQLNIDSGLIQSLHASLSGFARWW